MRTRFEELGYEIRLQRFRTSDGTRSWNVIATQPGGTNELLIGAHLDTVAPSPGGNDNASGVGILLELGRVLAMTPGGERVQLVAFGAEERQPAGGHHFGSLVYVRRMSSRPRMMVSVDMVGRHRPVIIGQIGIGPRDAVRAMRRAARKAGIPSVRQLLPDVSDHGPFEKAEVAAAFLWTGQHPDYHSAGDGPEDAQRSALGRVG
ncbi:MAG TPA: M28 family peptidase, partial [Actinomycetota bacterium]|nr:M28 family peptidase [Actinomycetota bacterium]